MTDTEISECRLDEIRVQNEIGTDWRKRCLLAEAKIRNIKFFAKDHAEPGYECALCLIEGIIDGKVALLNLPPEQTEQENL